MTQQQNKELGKRLREFRIKKFGDAGLRRVADKIDLDYSYLYRIEEGLYTPSDDVLTKIATEYQLTSEETLELLGLAHITPAFRKVLDKAGPENLRSFAFYRKVKKK
ncbi:MAG: helix-turn-helix transcriptional regulator [Candidatus Yanofskybacteria bacterium]|nr:helix-turn-helix transcriptional regulator [Candidatus Yanofskybacteria bacterium]